MDYPKSVPNVGLVNGKFVDENTATGVVGSLIPSTWGNAVTDELLAVIKAAGLAPDEGNNGQLLVAIKSFKGRQRCTSSGSFPVPEGVTEIWVSGCAGGGGGGASLATNSSSFVTGGSGGGAGLFVIRVRIPVMPGQVIPYTIGAGGIGATPAANNASDGGATTLGVDGSLLNLLPGQRGLVGSGGTIAPGNYPGPQGGLGYPTGGYASDTTVFSGGLASGGPGGLGASTPFGNAGAPGRGAAGSSPPAFPGYGYGAGGSGAGGGYSSSVSAPGGAGADGLPGYLELEW
ncbi:glycine-rich domain-containing protein [Pseudomonas sp. LP_7_YM]|uniref:glycine-rich domain-containing protein n=1 Tax=Pseudomonas sp. LP_7_YM TaxID=2485137 RepID=UPI00105FB3D2|nr:hypothetical protein EC915_11379 [Pseudomonas sp. LP_7_YM]